MFVFQLNQYRIPIIKIRQLWDHLIFIMGIPILVRRHLYNESGRPFKNAYELVNVGALKSSLLNKLHIFQYMGKIFYVEFQRYPLKFHIKHLTHTLKNMIFLQCWKFTSSQIYELVCVFETLPWVLMSQVSLHVFTIRGNMKCCESGDTHQCLRSITGFGYKVVALMATRGWASIKSQYI